MVATFPENLSNLVLDITMSVPFGISHAQLVRAIRQTGYQHKGDSLSEDLHKVVRKLVRNGLIEKNPETRTIKVRECYK